MKARSKKEWFLLLALVAPFVFLAFVWAQVPNRVPIHFNVEIKPDGWWTKTPGLLVLPVTNVFMTLLCALLLRYDPRLAKNEPGTRLHVWQVMQTTLIAVSLLLGACTAGIVWAAWGDLSVVTWSIRLGLPLLLLALGNSLSKLRPNYVIGIRLRWTLESDAVWVRTHRFAGRMLVVLSLALLALVLVGVPSAMYTWALIGVIGVWSAACVLYAFSLSRQEGGKVMS